MPAWQHRLVRLLNMVPYLQANPKITIAEAAADLGVTRKQLRHDLDQLWMCGLPGYGPGDLIDFEFCGDTIDVTFSAGMDQPLRLTSTEATVLLTALRALTDIPGVVDPEAALRAIAKIEAAAGAAEVGRGEYQREDTGSDRENSGYLAALHADAAAVVRTALQHHRAVSMEYYSASRDAVSHRVIDPIQVLLVGEHSYVHAWSREAQGVRLFRFDRIVSAVMLDDPAVLPIPAQQLPPDTALFDGDPALPTAIVQVAPQASWALEYYPMRVIEELPDGVCRAAMTFASTEWMTRLVLGFGADITVVEPLWLVQHVQNTAAAALAAYDDMAATTLAADDISDEHVYPHC